MSWDTPAVCDDPKCRKIGNLCIFGNFGRYGRLLLVSCEAHETSLRKQMRKTMVWGSFPLDISVDRITSFC
jgi:hypothetical protein